MPFLFLFLLLFNAPLDVIDIAAIDSAPTQIEVDGAPLSWIQSLPQPVLP